MSSFLGILPIPEFRLREMSTIVDKFAVVLLLLFAGPASAQIKLSEVKTQTWVGFENPAVVNGVVVAGVNSKPVLSAVSTLIKVEQGEFRYKFVEVSAERIPTLETVELDEVDGGYRFKPDTPSGTYRVLALAFDPERGMSSKRLNVVVGGAPPKPDDPIPVPPVPDVVPNKYGLGKVAFSNAPDAATSKAYAKAYRQAGEFLYGKPTLKSIISDNAADAANPDRSVTAWLNQQLAGAKPSYKAAMAKAFTDSQSSRQFSREDWYHAFNEVAEALELVK